MCKCVGRMRCGIEFLFPPVDLMQNLGFEEDEEEDDQDLAKIKKRIKVRQYGSKGGDWGNADYWNPVRG